MQRGEAVQRGEVLSAVRQCRNARAGWTSPDSPAGQERHISHQGTMWPHYQSAKGKTGSGLAQFKEHETTVAG